MTILRLHVNTYRTLLRIAMPHCAFTGDTWQVNWTVPSSNTFCPSAPDTFAHVIVDNGLSITTRACVEVCCIGGKFDCERNVDNI